MSSSISIDNTSPLWTFSSPCNSSDSAWNFVQNLPSYYNNTESTTNVVGARASFIFQGTAVAYYGTMWAQGANATVYLDELSENISTVLTNGSTLQSIAIWSRSNLDPDTVHALTVEMTGGGTLDIDYVKVLTPPPAVTPPAMPNPAPAAFPISSKWSCSSTNSSGSPTPAATPAGQLASHSSKSVPMMVGTIVGSICAILAVVAVVFLRRRRRKFWWHRHGRTQVHPDSNSDPKPMHLIQDSEGYALTAPRVPGTNLKIDPWDPTPVFMTEEQRAEKRRELHSKLVLDISAVNLNKSRSSTSSLSPSPTKENTKTNAAIAVRPLPPVTDSMIVHTGGTDHLYASVPKISHDWEDDVDEKDAEEMYAAHSWEDDNSNEVEDMGTPLIGSAPTSPVPSSRLSSSHGGNASSLNSSSRANSRAHRILRSVRSRKSSNNMGKRSAAGHVHRSTAQTTSTRSTNFSMVATASSTPRTPSSSQSMTYGGKMLALTGPGSGSVGLSPPLVRPLPAPGGTAQYLPSPLSTSPPGMSTDFHDQQEAAVITSTSATAQPSSAPSSSWFFGGQRKRANARRPPMGPRTQTSGSDISAEAANGK
ncbi:hypothetical protein SCHPADRAFT_63178 [Schizopora paradoxa]|uniref:Transmembrane protein n=1 Tax=Schizopora paradoxa TaxID=27342 RepID=A0A0H2S5I9_9AGAM|nr:hypothetical protein SCHPADRAFT_63178 [Schizopora paradoxa]